jgi:malate dehydrogenase (oxaloacetate-decarboxylating)(NADP+)
MQQQYVQWKLMLSGRVDDKLRCTQGSQQRILCFFFCVVYVFPGIGLGASICGAKQVTDRMLYIAAKALAECVPTDVMERGQVFPHISAIRQVSHRIAVAVIEEALRDGLATKISPEDAEDLNGFVARKMYYPEYVPLIEKGTFT